MPNDNDGGGESTAAADHSNGTTRTISVIDDPSTSTVVLPLRMTSKVVKGFGRGSTDLGIPTANLDREAGKFSLDSFEDLPTGIYWGFCRIVGSDSENGDDGTSSSPVYKTACSIGFNPYYGNRQKTVEPHFIAMPESDRRHASTCGETLLKDFYDQTIRLSLVGYLRPELPFDGLEKLVAAIKKDIVDSERLCDGQDETTLKEKAWVASNAPIR